MKVLFISSSNIIGADLARKMKEEGHKVKLYIDDPERSENFENIVDKTDDWRNELEWVGKDGLIVFDDVGYGKEQDSLRSQGYSVFGGCEMADKLENDRQYAQKVFQEYGIKTVPIKDFHSITACIDFVKNNKGPWVIKQNGHGSKSLNYVAQFEDSRDLLDVLENYNAKPKYQLRTITLQQKVTGVEVGVGRFFNGEDWVGPIEMNIEHKKLFPGDLGPTTSEMGTLAWYDSNIEGNRLYQQTLAKLKSYLQKIGFKGEMEINFIVNEHGAFPLEATPRLGSPIVYLQTELHKTPWGEFMDAIARGKSLDFKYKRGYGIVVLVAVPPFPYIKKLKQISSKGINIYFDENMTEEDFNHIHFEGVALRKKNGHKQYYISDDQGYVLYVTSVGDGVAQAQDKAYKLIKKVFVPKMFYRNDIGAKFKEADYDKLKKWGYLA